jgi:hypothetical protein
MTAPAIGYGGTGGRMNEWTELKGFGDVACALADGMEIGVEVSGIWYEWDANTWYSSCRYRARPQPVKVKMLCYKENESRGLFWREEGIAVLAKYPRFPAGDISGEVSP